jgi:hypothetical protein
MLLMLLHLLLLLRMFLFHLLCLLLVMLLQLVCFCVVGFLLSGARVFLVLLLL